MEHEGARLARAWAWCVLVAVPKPPKPPPNGRNLPPNRRNLTSNRRNLPPNRRNLPPNRQIIYLDADNIPLRDPAALLDTLEYNSTGALLWQDFWDNTMAPQVRGLFGRGDRGAERNGARGAEGANTCWQTEGAKAGLASRGREGRAACLTAVFGAPASAWGVDGACRKGCHREANHTAKTVRIESLKKPIRRSKCWACHGRSGTRDPLRAGRWSSTKGDSFDRDSSLAPSPALQRFCRTWSATLTVSTPRCEATHTANSASPPAHPFCAGVTGAASSWRRGSIRTPTSGGRFCCGFKSFRVCIRAACRTEVVPRCGGLRADSVPRDHPLLSTNRPAPARQTPDNPFFPPKRYEVFTCFLGKGDKETFAYGMAVAREPYYVITTAPAAVGTTGEPAGAGPRRRRRRAASGGDSAVRLLVRTPQQRGGPGRAQTEAPQRTACSKQTISRRGNERHGFKPSSAPYSSNRWPPPRSPHLRSRPLNPQHPIKP